MVCPFSGISSTSARAISNLEYSTTLPRTLKLGFWVSYRLDKCKMVEYGTGSSANDFERRARACARGSNSSP